MKRVIVLGLLLAACHPRSPAVERCRKQNIERRLARGPHQNVEADRLEDMWCDEHADIVAAMASSSSRPPPKLPPSSAPSTPRHFECESRPSMGDSTRSCVPSDVTHETMCKRGGGCFSQDQAFCFFHSRSAAEMLARATPLPAEQRWSPTEVGQDCLATQAECTESREMLGKGTSGQPPVKSPCIQIPIREASSDP